MNAITQNDKEIRNRLIRFIMDNPGFVRISQWANHGVYLCFGNNDKEFLNSWSRIDSFLYQNGR